MYKKILVRRKMPECPLGMVEVPGSYGRTGGTTQWLECVSPDKEGAEAYFAANGDIVRGNTIFCQPGRAGKIIGKRGQTINFLQALCEKRLQVVEYKVETSYHLTETNVVIATTTMLLGEKVMLSERKESFNNFAYHSEVARRGPAAWRLFEESGGNDRKAAEIKVAFLTEVL